MLPPGQSGQPHPAHQGAGRQHRQEEELWHQGNHLRRQNRRHYRGFMCYIRRYLSNNIDATLGAWGGTILGAMMQEDLP